MERYRITTTKPDATEQTWVLLPDRASAVMQAEELANREKETRVRVYREIVSPDLQVQKELDLDLNSPKVEAWIEA